ncbi:MAG: ribulose-phosphate 3-epimerase [Candidatus Margulisiibacteriota bacterium]
MIKLAPSILSADFCNLGTEIKKVAAAGADLIHIDVMDGHFVPNITIGPLVVAAARRATRLPLDVHLMIEDPDKYLEAFAAAGADILSVHAEVCRDLPATIKKIKQLKVEPAVAVNPDKPLSTILPVLNQVKMVLLMTVFPGFGGQKFIADVIPKIKELKSLIVSRKLKVDIEVDGGIDPTTAPRVVAAGANVLVAGSAIYHAKNWRQIMEKLKNVKT